MNEDELKAFLIEAESLGDWEAAEAALSQLEEIQKNKKPSPSAWSQSLPGQYADYVTDVTGELLSGNFSNAGGMMRDAALGILEPAATIGSGALAEVAAGTAGLASLPFVGLDDSVDVINRVRDAGTYSPRTKAGQERLAAIGDSPVAGLLNKFNEGSEWLGTKTLEATGSPLLAAAAHTGPTAALELLPLGAAKRFGGVRRVSGVVKGGKTVPKRQYGGVSATRSRPVRQPQGLLYQSDEAADLARMNSGQIDDVAAQQARAETFRRAGLVDDAGPTRAQITRNKTDFQTQQELAKKSNVVNERLEMQQGILGSKFDEAIEATGGQPVSGISSVADDIIGRSTRADDAISRAYTLAEEMAPKTQNIDLTSYVNRLAESTGDNLYLKGMISSLTNDLKNKGIIKNKKIARLVSAKEAHDVRKYINRHFNGANGEQRFRLHELKEHLDNDVRRVVGKNVFKEADSLKAAHEAGLRKAKISKYDSSKTNLVKDIRDNTVDPDSLAKTVSTSKKYRAEHIRQLRDYLNQTDSGKAAWRDFQAEVLDQIKQDSFRGPLDQLENLHITRASFERALKRIGDPKIKEIFDVSTQQFLDLIDEVVKLQEPIAGTQQGLGPSAQAVAKITKMFKDMPFGLEEFVYDLAGRRLGKYRVPDAPVSLLTPDYVPGAVAGGLISGAAQAEKRGLLQGNQ